MNGSLFGIGTDDGEDSSPNPQPVPRTFIKLKEKKYLKISDCETRNKLELSNTLAADLVKIFGM